MRKVGALFNLCGSDRTAHRLLDLNCPAAGMRADAQSRLVPSHLRQRKRADSQHGMIKIDG